MWCQDGWILAKFFHAFLFVDVNIHLKASWSEQAWSKKGLIYSQKQNSFLGGNKAGNSERAWWANLARSGSQSECWIRFILPAHGFSHIIIGRKNRFKVSLTKDKLLCWHEKHEQVVRTHWTSYQSSRPSTLSWIFTSQLVLVSVGPGPRS